MPRAIDHYESAWRTIPHLNETTERDTPREARPGECRDWRVSLDDDLSIRLADDRKTHRVRIVLGCYAPQTVGTG